MYLDIAAFESAETGHDRFGQGGLDFPDGSSIGLNGRYPSVPVLFQQNQAVIAVFCFFERLDYCLVECGCSECFDLDCGIALNNGADGTVDQKKKQKNQQSQDKKADADHSFSASARYFSVINADHSFLLSKSEQ